MTDTEQKVEYSRLGSSGLKISNPIVGGMSFGDTRWQPWVTNEAETLPILKAAYDSGINTWDTANVYSNGVSEEIFAKAIKTYNIPRERLVIMTKCFATVGSSYSKIEYSRIFMFEFLVLIYPGYWTDEPGLLTFVVPEIEKTKEYVNQQGMLIFESNPDLDQKLIYWRLSRTLPQGNLFCCWRIT